MSRIASRYAKSLIDLAQEQGKLDRVLEDIKSFQSATKNREFYNLLKSPIINSTKKSNIFKAIFGEQFDKLSSSFLDIVLKKGREQYLAEIADEFVNQYKEINSITTVTVTTAKPLSEAGLAKIKTKLEGSADTRNNIDIITKVNPDIIGGFILEFEDKLFDSSIAHQLAMLRKEFGKNEIAPSDN